ncbi:hypothetical protein H5410_062907 [Solanum commersonii]|uniref:Uncharacterized protein n=1 Tax=Solanum commersonii TaxID=4109 RepID=A0A9J5WC93_SOLCO|nr:hypothetical protein H5410_062907 [Solanum commersonii]
MKSPLGHLGVDTNIIRAASNNDSYFEVVDVTVVKSVDTSVNLDNKEDAASDDFCISKPRRSTRISSLMEEDPTLKYLADSIQGVKESFSSEISEMRSTLKEVVGHVMALGSQNGTSVATTPRPRQTTEVYGSQASITLILRHKSASVELGRFHGVNPESWVFQAEHYFEFYGITEDHKLTLASFYLEGDALECR